MPAKQGTSKATDRSKRNEQSGRAGTRNRVGNTGTQAGRPTPKKTSVPRPEETLTGAVRNPGVGSLKEYDRRKWELKQVQEAKAAKAADFVRRHIALAQAYGAVTTLTNTTASEAVGRYFEHYAGITETELTTPQGLKVKRGQLAYEKTLASFPQNQHNEVKHGIGRARQALSAVYAEANGGDKTPDYQPAAKPTRQKLTASNKVDKPTLQPSMPKDVTPTFVDRHATLATSHKLVTDLQGVARTMAVAVLKHYALIKGYELEDGEGGKVKRTDCAVDRARAEFRPSILEEEAAALDNGQRCARKALKLTYDEVNGTKTREPKLVSAQPVQSPSKIPGITPAIFAAPKPMLQEDRAAS